MGKKVRRDEFGLPLDKSEAIHNPNGLDAKTITEYGLFRAVCGHEFMTIPHEWYNHEEPNPNKRWIPGVQADVCFGDIAKTCRTSPKVNVYSTAAMQALYKRCESK